MPCSIDIGTMFLVKGELDVATEEPEFITERNCFLQAATTDDTEDTLKENNWTYARHTDNYYILGEDAIKLKNLLTVGSKDPGIVMTKIGELRRPMKHGILNTGEEKLSVAIIQKLIANLLGKPNHPGEVLCFCAPGDPVDKSLSVVFHRTMLTNFLKSLGYTVECIPEALAIIFSQRPVAKDPTEDGGEAPFSGIAFSCLPPGQKIITQKGFCNIENIQSGDFVLAKEGHWAKVQTPTQRHYKGDIITIHAYGHGKISLTGDHKVWIKHNKTWQWIEAKNIEEDDYVMQPWISNYDTKERLYMRWTERVTCSEPRKVQKEITGKEAELLGYFLGDGHTEQHDGCVAWTFASKEHDNITRVRELCESIFGKPCSLNKHGENDTRLKLYHKGFASYLKRTCYDGNDDKIVPVGLEKMSDNCILFMLRGLVKSDGWETDEGFRFGNTSSNLAQFYYLATQKLGFKPSFNVRKPRIGAKEIEPGRRIVGQKEEYTISCSGILSQWFIRWMDHPHPIAWKSFIDGISVARIHDIEIENYSGMVYDLSTKDSSHSFCLPGFAVHNCGAGMMNICMSWKKMPLINFSIAQSGDYIDEQAAATAGISVSAMTRYKESHLDLNNIDYSDMRQAALAIFYQNTIEHALNNFAEKFNQLDNNIDVPLEIVIAGGTAKIPGFTEKFQEVIGGLELPFQVKSVRLADNPFFAVSHGCLVKAMALEKKSKAAKTETGSQKVENKEEPPPKRAKLK